MPPYPTSVSTAFTNYANFHENCVNSSVTLYMQWAPYIIIIEVYCMDIFTYRYSCIQIIWKRIRSTSQTLIFSYIFATQFVVDQIFQTANSVTSNNLSLKYQKYPQVAKIQGKENLSLWQRLNSILYQKKPMMLFFHFQILKISIFEIIRQNIFQIFTPLDVVAIAIQVKDHLHEKILIVESFFISQFPVKFSSPEGNFRYK